MPEFVVAQVRRRRAADGTHRHVVGLCATTGEYFSVRQVVDSINDGAVWTTRIGCRVARIRVVPFCPHTACLASPYLRARVPRTGKDDLDVLDEV